MYASICGQMLECGGTACAHICWHLLAYASIQHVAAYANMYPHMVECAGNASICAYVLHMPAYAIVSSIWLILLKVSLEKHYPKRETNSFSLDGVCQVHVRTKTSHVYVHVSVSMHVCVSGAA